MLEIKESLRLTGNNFLFEIFNKKDFSKKDDLKELYNYIKNYNKNLYIDIESSKENEEEKKSKKLYFSYIFIKNKVINAKNIDTIFLTKEFNIKKQKFLFGIRIKKKYPTPLEEDYEFIFDTEEERDKNFDILRGKLNICSQNVL